MKITQTDTQIELKSNGIGQFLLGVALTVVGVGVTFFLVAVPSDNGKKAPAWSYLVGLAFALVGILAAISAKNRTIVGQKGGETTVRDKRLLGGSPRQQSVPTANIIAVRLYTYAQSNATDGGLNSNAGTTRRSVLSLVLNNNDVIEIGSSGNSGFSFNGMNIGSLIAKAPLSKEANQVAAFLGVPLQADDASSITGALKSVKEAFGQGQAPQAPQATSSSSPQPQPAPPAAPATSTPQPAPATDSSQPPQTPTNLPPAQQ
jgi:hypothetical protein